ncbi:MAG: xanthine dehydrogenase family protein subunit M [Streptosporangiales bacterium]|nr:xanthine dehydrogenase family protein subunit M [Streptosporangiales bacterium]
MIPAAFDYTCPAGLDEAVSSLAEAGEDAKLLAGGQSLVPVLRLRLAVPTVLVDLGRVEELRGVRDDGDALVIGAMTTHHDVLADPLVREHAPLLALATETVGDRQVRNVGTVGGSIAHADPAGDLPAVAVALDAEMVIANGGGRRTVPAREFFVDYLTTVLQPDDVLVEVRVPKLGGWGVHYEKFHRTAQAWAIVGVAAAVRRENGSVAQARVTLTNMGSVPIRCTSVEQALAGGDASSDAVAAAAEHATEGTSPSADQNASPDYRQHLARVLTGRAVAKAAGL